MHFPSRYTKLAELRNDKVQKTKANSEEEGSIVDDMVLFCNIMVLVYVMLVLLSSSPCD